MSTITIPKEVHDQIRAAKDWPIQLCDESGNFVGTLEPRFGTSNPPMTPEEMDELFPPEKIEAIRRDPRPLIPMEEVMKRLGIQ